MDFFTKETSSLRNATLSGVGGNPLPQFFTYPTRDFPNTDVEQFAVFIQDEIRLLNDKLLLLPGFRFDNYDADVILDSVYSTGNAGQSAPEDYSDSQLTKSFGLNFKLDEKSSIFARYVMPKSNSEIYAEYSLDDNRFDFEDLWVSPEHSRAYILGFHKIQPLKTRFEYIELIYEMTQIESSKEALNRIQFGTPIFYPSDYNHFGQNIGAGIGTGSNQWILEIHLILLWDCLS